MKRVHRFVTNDFTVRASSVIATHVVQEMQNIQQTYPLATLGVGRAMVGALLMAAQLKEKQEVGLLFRGNGPLSSVYAEASFEGHVRGYCPNPQYEPPRGEDPLDLGRAFGSGLLTVARHQPFQKSPFQGTVEMQTGEIGDDLAHYLHQSQQIRSIVSVGVFLDSYGKVQAAGGTLIEVMPGVEDEIVNVLERNSQVKRDSVSQLIFDGATPTDLVSPLLQGLPFTEIPHEFELKYACPCTPDRVKRAMSLLGEVDLQEMLDEKKPASVQCQVCGRSYEVSIHELQNLKDAIHRQGLH